ncbi:MAG: VWA domain-containing protein [Acidobacteriia bacterium]|nr:VWA domain-containing protein [Terriglobia bacterium]
MRGRFQVVTMRFVLIVLAALPLLYSQTIQPQRGQAVYVLAARDSHLFTMCPTTEAVSFLDGKTWKSNGNARVVYPSENEAVFTFFDENGSLTNILPLPAAGAGVAATRPVPGRAELDRVAPDPDIKQRIEKEFLKRKEYVIVDSPGKADLVFLAEGTYLPMMIGTLSAPNSLVFAPRGDNKAEFLQTVFAIVVPAAAFNPEAVRSASLMNARLWEGSVTWKRTRMPRGVEIAPASPEAVAAQFHNKEKRPPSHFPLCAASAQTLRIAGTPSVGRAAAPELKTDPVLPPASPTLAEKPAGESQAFRVDVTLVTVPVMVMDQDGKYVSDLNYSDFHVFEDGVEQKIDRIIPEAEPFDVALMLDTSTSMRLKATEIQKAALAFAGAIRPDDRLMVVSFDNRIYVHSEPTADRLQLRAAISLLRPDEGTRLFDAVDLVLADRLDAIRGRKAILLFTDGVDTRSRIAGSVGTLAAAEESNVLVYGIQYDTSKESGLKPFPGVSSWVVLPEDIRNNSERYRRADKYLLSLCDGSGGELYVAQPGADPGEVFARIAEQLRHQFTLCYYPSDSKKDGAFHRLRVEVDCPGVKVRARTGYRAPANNKR